jgi:putative transposase
MKLDCHCLENLKEKYSIESKYLWIDLPKNLSLNTIEEIEIVPKTLYRHTTYFVYIVYKKDISEVEPADKKMMGID